MNAPTLPGWERLRHGGLLLDPQRLSEVAAHIPEALPHFYERDLRKRIGALQDTGGATSADISGFVAFVLHSICGFDEMRWSPFFGQFGSWAKVDSGGLIMLP